MFRPKVPAASELAISASLKLSKALNTSPLSGALEAEPDPEAPEVMPGTLTGAAKMLKAPEAAGVALAVNCSPCLRSHIAWVSPPETYMTSRQKHEGRLPTTHRKRQFCSALSCTSIGFLRELPDSQDPYGIAQQELQQEHGSSHKELI